jgi:hypothetical protein
MKHLIEGAEFGGRTVDENHADSLTRQADALVAKVRRAAG